MFECLNKFFKSNNSIVSPIRKALPPDNKPHILISNKELSQYLVNYAAADKECPEFAVGIYGDWGIGKTFFIQEWLEYHSINHCYLSLFGISSTDDIEKAIFKTEHLLEDAISVYISVA